MIWGKSWTHFSLPHFLPPPQKSCLGRCKWEKDYISDRQCASASKVKNRKTEKENLIPELRRQNYMSVRLIYSWFVIPMPSISAMKFQVWGIHRRIQQKPRHCWSQRWYWGSFCRCENLQLFNPQQYLQDIWSAKGWIIYYNNNNIRMRVSLQINKGWHLNLN